MMIFDLNEIVRGPLSNTNQGVLYLKNCLIPLGSHAVSNVVSEYFILNKGPNYFPVTANRDEVNENSYVVSPITAYVRYAEYEVHALKRRLVSILLVPIIRILSVVLKRAKLDAIVYVNNWLLSTNLYPPDWKGEDLPETTAILTKKFVDCAVGYRSLNFFSNGQLLNALSEAGYILIASRQVYIFDARSASPAFLDHHNVAMDLNSLSKSQYTLVMGDCFTDLDFDKSERLYNLLYLEKYSELNPQFTSQWLKCGQRDGWLSLFGLRSAEGEIEGVVGFFANDEILTAPIVGYDTRLPKKLGLYRLLTALCFQEAIRRRAILNFSSGAAHFKRLRGGVPHIEYSAVYVKHLPLYRRAAWYLLQFVANGIGVPMMRFFQL